jgi:hypothetical protein
VGSIPTAPARQLNTFICGGRGEGVNAPDCGSGIRGFESHRSPHVFEPIAQRIEHWSPEPGAQVRVLVGSPLLFAVVVELADTPS